MKYLAIPSPDGLRLEEVNPNPKPVDEMYGWHTASSFDDPHSGWLIEGGEEAYYEALKKWFAFVPRSFLTDDPRVVVGQQYPAEEYELVEQAKIKEEWFDILENVGNITAVPTRQILRRKAEGEKDRQRRGINEIFEAEAGDENNGWISVKDRLPEAKGNIIIYGCYTRDCPNRVYEGYYHKSSRKFYSTDGIRSKNVTHWMPLPQPPKTN